MKFFDKKNEEGNLFRDLAVIIFSIVVAVLMVKTDVVTYLLASTHGMAAIGSFISGIFFVSIFTTAPATVAIGEITRTNSIFLVAFFGSLGSVVGDLLIFRFVKDHVSEDFSFLIKKSGLKRFTAIFKTRAFHWLFAFLGALVVASPLPDELAMSMMGLAKVKTSIIIPLSFVLNFLGIIMVGLVARAL
jgi:hypothetical protein